MKKIVPSLKQQKDSFSFRQNTRRRFALQVTRIRQKYNLQRMVLVLDLSSAKFISSLFTITELVDQSIVFVQRLQMVRKALDNHAIYFITPSETSIDFMLNDFQQESSFKYRKVHVLLTSSLDKNLIKKISKHPYFLKKIARHSFKQFYCQLEILSDNCAHLQLPYLSVAFSEDSNEQQQIRMSVGKRFVDFVAGYDQLHTIRIYYQFSKNKVAERIAEKAAKQLKNYLFNLLDAKSPAIKANAQDLTIYITDRSIDVITPLLHGYAYESLLYDLLQVKNDEQQKGLDINTLKGQIFEQFRYRHISHALEVLPDRLQKLADKIKNPGKIEGLDIKKMKQDKQNLQVHLEVLRRLWQKFQQKKISEIGELQLSLATGITQEGRQTSSIQIFNQIIALIKTNVTLSVEELLRLALLTLTCIKLSKQDYQTILQLFKEQHRTILRNVAVFGITYDRKITRSTKSIDKTTMEMAKNKLKTTSMASERFTCALEIVLPRLKEFLSIERNQSQKKFMEEIVVSVQKEENYITKFDGKRLICFMSGGLSQSEICSIRHNPMLSDILLVSDTILTPNNFIQQLNKIDILDNSSK